MNQPCLVIMAAGMGSRFGGPKQTTPVDEYGHFLLHYSLFDAYRAGFRKVVFVVKEDTAAEFRESVGAAVAAAFDVRYAYQKLDTLPTGYTVPDGRTKPWGTAHAVLCAAPEIDGPFAVINSDDYYGIEAYRLLYDFLAVPRPERSYAMVGFRLRNTVTANGSVASLIAAITLRLHSLMRLLSVMGHPPYSRAFTAFFSVTMAARTSSSRATKDPRLFWLVMLPLPSSSM